jgi:hypothetical protein
MTAGITYPDAAALRRITMTLHRWHELKCGTMAKYPALQSYVQGDPRGASLYVLRPDDVPAGKDAESYYNRGIAIYR